MHANKYFSKLLFSITLLPCLFVFSCNNKKTEQQQTSATDSLASEVKTETPQADKKNPWGDLKTNLQDQVFDGEIKGKKIKISFNIEPDSPQSPNTIIVGGYYYFEDEGEDAKRMLNGFVEAPISGAIISEQYDGKTRASFKFKEDDALGLKFITFINKKSDAYSSCVRVMSDTNEEQTVIFKQKK
jgi:hypothetical protein